MEDRVYRVHALLTIVREHVARFGGIELYAMWDGNEHVPPKGAIELSVSSLDPETFFFNEQFFCRIGWGTQTMLPSGSR